MGAGAEQWLEKPRRLAGLSAQRSVFQNQVLGLPTEVDGQESTTRF